MSFLTKKLLFFLVFYNLSNFTTSDDTRIQNCINNVKRIFYSNENHTNFIFAMFALSENSITSSLLATDADTLVLYFRSFYFAIREFGNDSFTTRYDEVIAHFEALDSLDTYNDVSSLDERRNDLLGYFQSFVAHFGNDELQRFGVDYFLAGEVDILVYTPWKFCEQHCAKGKVDYFECYYAITIMLDVKGDPRTTIETVYNMKGSQAFKICYLKYTYLDFYPENPLFDFTIKKYELNQKKSNVESSTILNESDKQGLTNIMIKYFIHMVEMSSRIGKRHSELTPPKNRPLPYGRSLFLTVDEYCRVAAKQNRS